MKWHGKSSDQGLLCRLGLSSAKSSCLKLATDLWNSSDCLVARIPQIEGFILIDEAK